MFPVWTLLPIATFWLTSTFLYCFGFDSQANINDPKNKCTLKQTLIRMLLLNVIQVSLTLPLEFCLIPELMPKDQINGFRIAYFLFGVFLLDAMEYFLHRLYHSNSILYMALHKTHHEMKSCFSFGALYNSISESIITAGLISFVVLIVFKFTLQEYSIVQSLAVFATVLDHCSYFDNINILGRKQFHSVHHEKRYYILVILSSSSINAAIYIKY